METVGRLTDSDRKHAGTVKHEHDKQEIELMCVALCVCLRFSPIHSQAVL